VVKFPVNAAHGRLAQASVVIWTTTPWTLPGNRAISFSPKISYGLYKITDAPADNWAKTGDLLILADKLAEDVFKQSRVTSYEKAGDVSADILDAIECSHPLKGLAGGYEFVVPLLAGDHVTDDTGTGFVHTAPPRPRGLRCLDRQCARARSARHQLGYSLHCRCRRRADRARAGLHRQARSHRQGRRATPTRPSSRRWSSAACCWRVRASSTSIRIRGARKSR
jgi:hypothetical protein